MTTGPTSDHFQTPPYALAPLLPFLNRDWFIWEPAAGKGNIVRTLRDTGYCVGASDILPEEGEEFKTKRHCFDFLKWFPPREEQHAIVTNPPFSLKDEFLARCYEIGLPFALLMPLTALEGQKRQALYKAHGLELIIPNRRIAFETPTGREGKASSPQFLTAWYTHGLDIGSALTFADMPLPEHRRKKTGTLDL